MRKYHGISGGTLNVLERSASADLLLVVLTVSQLLLNFMAIFGGALLELANEALLRRGNGCSEGNTTGHDGVMAVLKVTRQSMTE
jgi:hypothetical protein